jgi:hypothetical protein
MSYIAARKKVENRRKQEDSYRDLNSAIAQDKKQLQIAKFEIQTCLKIDKNLQKVMQ